MQRKTPHIGKTMTPDELTGVLKLTALVDKVNQMLNACGLDTEQMQTLWFMTPENVVQSFINAVNAKGSNDPGSQANGLKTALIVIAEVRRVNLPLECDIKPNPSVGAN